MANADRLAGRVLTTLSEIEKFIPAGMRDTVEKFGAEKTWQASLRILEYPFTWAKTFGEFEAIRIELEKCL